MRLASWNINSIRVRAPRLLRWLARREPDVVCLQELKADEGRFPFEPLREAGYFAAVHAEPRWNGVAILAREPIRRVRKGFDDGEDDGQARFVEGRVGPLRVLSVYVPNGGVVGSDKWRYKLRWMERLRRYLDRECDPAEALVLAGDFNVAPDDADVADPDRWRATVLCHEDARAAFDRICAWGLVDVVRRLHPEGGVYTWWDYRGLAFARGDGLRLDHVLLTRPLADRAVAATVDRDERKGRQPSDHAPVVVDLAEAADPGRKPSPVRAAYNAEGRR